MEIVGAPCRTSGTEGIGHGPSSWKSTEGIGVEAEKRKSLGLSARRKSMRRLRSVPCGSSRAGKPPSSHEEFIGVFGGSNWRSEQGRSCHPACWSGKIRKAFTGMVAEWTSSERVKRRVGVIFAKVPNSRLEDSWGFGGAKCLSVPILMWEMCEFGVVMRCTSRSD